MDSPTLHAFWSKFGKSLFLHTRVSSRRVPAHSIPSVHPSIAIHPWIYICPPSRSSNSMTSTDQVASMSPRSNLGCRAQSSQAPLHARRCGVDSGEGVSHVGHPLHLQLHASSHASSNLLGKCTSTPLPRTIVPRVKERVNAMGSIHRGWDCRARTAFVPPQLSRPSCRMYST